MKKTLKIKQIVTIEKLQDYFKITGEAIKEVKKGGLDSKRKEQAEDFLDMAERYYSDANYFKEEGDYVLSFAALNYAHGWLDAGARSGLFNVDNDRLFTVEKNKNKK